MKTLYLFLNFRNFLLALFSFSVQNLTQKRYIKDARVKFSNIDFFLKILPLKDDELAMPKM